MAKQYGDWLKGLSLERLAKHIEGLKRRMADPNNGFQSPYYQPFLDKAEKQLEGITMSKRT